MEEVFNNFIGNIAFPILVTTFLLTRVEKRLEELNETIMNLMELLIKYKGNLKASDNYD